MADFVYHFEMWHLPAVFCIGVAASFINSIAGGGSILSLPMFIFMGLPQAYAHGTNRMGLIPGAVSSALELKKKGLPPAKRILLILMPVILGTLLGTLLVINLPDKIFNPILAVVILLLVIFTDLKVAVPATHHFRLKIPPVAAVGCFFLLGFYAGFIQVGVGLVMVFLFSKTIETDLIGVNALKCLVAVIFLTLAFLIFLIHGKIVLTLGLIFGAGNYLGGWLGAKWQINQGVKWAQILIKMMGIIMAAKLLWKAFS